MGESDRDRDAEPFAERGRFSPGRFPSPGAGDRKRRASLGDPPTDFAAQADRAQAHPQTYIQSQSQSSYGYVQSSHAQVGDFSGLAAGLSRRRRSRSEDYPGSPPTARQTRRGSGSSTGSVDGSGGAGGGGRSKRRGSSGGVIMIEPESESLIRLAGQMRTDRGLTMVAGLMEVSDDLRGGRFVRVTVLIFDI